VGTTTDVWIQRELKGRYRIVRKIGGGGMGALYEGVQLELDRPVAIKLIKPQIDDVPEALERFRREARSVAKLTSPNIVSIFDFDSTEDGTMFLVLELLSGQSLRQQLRGFGRLTFAETLPVIRSIAVALEHAHSLGIVHRDIKPENVMITDDGLVKVLDFGIARMLDNDETSMTRTGAVVGTPGYLAPELVSDGEVQPAGDLFALGMLWAELLLGRFPFSAKTPVALMFKTTNDDLPRLKALDPSLQVPEAGQALITSMTQRPLEHRLSSAAELLLALDEHFPGTGPTAAIPTGPGRPSLASAPTQASTRPMAPQVNESTRTPTLGATLIREPTGRVGAAIAGGVFAIALFVAGGWAFQQFFMREPPPPVLAAVDPAPAPRTAPPAPTPAPAPAPAAAEPEPTTEPSAEPAVEPAAEPARASRKKRRRPSARKASSKKTAPTSRQIASAIRASFGQAAACRNTVFKARAGGGILVNHCPSYDTIAGKHWVKLKLHPDGSVGGAKFSSKALNDPLAHCTLESLKHWSFPAFAGEPIEITQRIAFEQCVPINGRCVN
jgi:serine/threonine-protein kinase